MRNRKKISFILVLALILSIIPNNMVSSARPKLSEKTKTLTVGKSAKIKITGAKELVKWSVSNKHIKITKKANDSAIVKAVSKGTSNLIAEINGKSYKCKFTVKAVPTAKPTNNPTSTNTPVPTSMPPTDIEVPTETPEQTVEPAQNPIPAETQKPILSIEPTQTPVPTVVPTINPTSNPISIYVWIPATGSKYHSTSTCSGMKNPKLVTVSQAISSGYTACKKCYK